MTSRVSLETISNENVPPKSSHQHYRSLFYALYRVVSLAEERRTEREYSEHCQERKVTKTSYDFTWFVWPKTRKRLARIFGIQYSCHPQWTKDDSAFLSGDYRTRILNAPTVVQRWWISCCKPIAIRHPEDCTPQRLTFLVELVDTIQDKEEDTELYYSNRVTIGRVFSQLAQQGIDLESVCPQLEKLYSDNVPGALFLSKALCIHNKRTGKEPEIRPLLKQLKKRAKGHCPNPVINYRRTLGKEEKGQSSKHIHWAHCAACLSQKVRLLYFNENDGWGYNDRIWEFRCLKCAKYTIYADT